MLDSIEDVDMSNGDGLWPTFLEETSTFACVRSQYTRGYIGEKCEYSVDCSRDLDLRCGWKSSDSSDSRNKICIARE